MRGRIGKITEIEFDVSKIRLFLHGFGWGERISLKTRVALVIIKLTNVNYNE